MEDESTWNQKQIVCYGSNQIKIRLIFRKRSFGKPQTACLPTATSRNTRGLRPAQRQNWATASGLSTWQPSQEGTYLKLKTSAVTFWETLDFACHVLVDIHSCCSAAVNDNSLYIYIPFKSADSNHKSRPAMTKAARNSVICAFGG